MSIFDSLEDVTKGGAAGQMFNHLRSDRQADFQGGCATRRPQPQCPGLQGLHTFADTCPHPTCDSNPRAGVRGVSSVVGFGFPWWPTMFSLFPPAYPTVCVLSLEKCLFQVG